MFFKFCQAARRNQQRQLSMAPARASWHVFKTRDREAGRRKRGRHQTVKNE
jgi:hypothetical protein